MKRINIILTLLITLAIIGCGGSQKMAGYNTNVYMEQGGDNLVVKNGGSITIEDGGEFVRGTGSDISEGWDGTDYDVVPAVSGSDYNFGSATYLLDIFHYGDFAWDGATAGRDIQWDRSENTLEVLDNAVIAVGTGDDWTVAHNGSTTTATGALTHAGDIIVSGTTPAITVGDAGEEDAQVNFDGNAQDFHIGLDDTADDLVIGLGTALGTTPAVAIDENLNVTISSSLKYPVETVAAANVITANEAGKIFVLSSATEFQSTLPTASTASGAVMRFIVGAAPSGASYTIVTGNSLENVIYGNVLEAETDTNDDGPVASQEDTITIVDGVAVVGDWVEVVCDGTNWYVSGMTAADGGVTLTQAD